MRQGTRSAVFDKALGVEAFRFDGIAQPFPYHFHDYYVVGLVERGRRGLFCNGLRRDITPGDIVVFNPGDSHGCKHQGRDSFSYHSLNIPQACVSKVLCGKEKAESPLRFPSNVIADSKVGAAFLQLHVAVVTERGIPERFRCFETLLDALAPYASRPGAPPAAFAYRAQVEAACKLMRQHYASPLRLERLCSHVGLSASTFLRAFSAEKGITPYRYLEAVRVQAAKTLLAQGVPPVQVAALTGFSDQSHLTNCFGALVGLTPGRYQGMFARGEGTHGQSC